MTAGSGIVHSERTAPEDRPAGPPLHGIQTWVALPRAHEGTAPEFHHHPKETLPLIEASGARMRVIAGTAFGKRSPVRTWSDTLYVAAELDAGGAIALDAEHEERGIYVVEGGIEVDGVALTPMHMVVLPADGAVTIRAGSRARVMLLGGAKMDGDRHIWWNFVASSRELIEDAKARWREGRFPPVPGETEFIPLPESR
jgi:redox-sensitive bicupin YhaK (pirin superfamily)